MNNSEMLFWVLGNLAVHGIFYAFVFRTVYNIKRAVDDKTDMHDRTKRRALITELMRKNAALQEHLDTINEQQQNDRVARAERSLKEY